MNKSESIAQLACSLSKFQGEIFDATKDTQAHNHKYAELAQMLSIARPFLAKYGLCVTQLISNTQDSVTVETVLMHESGEYISSELSMPAAADGGRMNVCQKIGSAISYARKYSYMSILGFTQKGEDDDAESISNKPEFKKFIPQMPPPEKINETQIKQLLDLIEQDGVSQEEFLEKMKIKNMSEITISRFEKLVERFTQKIFEGTR